MDFQQPFTPTSEQIVKLLSLLFHQHFCLEEKVEGCKKAAVLPAYFFGWLDSHLDMFSTDQRQVMTERLGVPFEVWNAVSDLIASGLAVERLGPLWYAVVLDDRDPPRHALAALDVVILLRWHDGTVSKFQSHVEDAMIGPAGFTDAAAVMVAGSAIVAAVQALAEEGVDGFYARGQDLRGATIEDPYEVFMGLVLKCLPQLHSDLRAPVGRYLNLVQQLLRMPVPKYVLAQIQTLKDKNFPARGPVTGGFDV